MAIVKVPASDARSRRGVTNWAKIKKVTEQEITRSAMLNPDARLLRDDEIGSLRRDIEKPERST